MTKEEAIDILNTTRLYSGRANGKMVYAEALNMAINALMAEDNQCEDAVSRKKMFETIVEYRNQLCEIFGDESALVNTVDIVKHRLIALPSVQPEQKWIPCSERPPRKEGKYLVTPSPVYSNAIDITIAYWCRGWIGYNQSEVLAWMPLPKSYLEEGESDG